MSNCFGLSKMEMELMDMFWEENRHFTFKELLDYCINKTGQDWNKQTLQTDLKKLINKGVLSCEKQEKLCFYPTSSKDEYILECEKLFFQKSYLAPFSEDIKILESEGKWDKLIEGKLRKELLDDLREFLNSY